jgi:hypothetical protein
MPSKILTEFDPIRRFHISGFSAVHEAMSARRAATGMERDLPESADKFFTGVA